MKKIYYLCRLTQQSPLRISSGEGAESDSDLMKDGRGYPYIPGSSLAGVLRSMLDEPQGNRLFGCLADGKAVESRIIVSDAVFQGTEKDFIITIRDGVRLNDDGIAEDTGKYDFEVVETEKPYIAVLELTDAGEDLEETMHQLLCTAQENGISLGGRTTRGYGRMKVKIYRKVFSFPENLQNWLDWDPFADGAAEQMEPLQSTTVAPSQEMTVIEAGLQMEGSFTVRVFSGHDNVKDYTYMTPMNTDGREQKAVIPGTSWAGVFRHHMRMLAAGIGSPGLQQDIDDLFGVPKNGDKQDIHRSRIIFDEMTVSGGKPYKQIRIAVDRFTNAPKAGALLEEEVYQGGNGRLVIRFPKNEKPVVQQLLAAALLDLQHSILHIGGEGAVGRGTASILKMEINGADVTEQLKKDEVLLPYGEVSK